MRTMARRLVLVLLLAPAGAALAAPTASAGGFADDGTYKAAVYNFTPYTWTLVGASTPPGGGACGNNSCWNPAPAQTIAPGESPVYGLRPNYIDGGGITFGYTFGYASWMTYRVNVVGGPPEYVTVALSQEYETGLHGSAIPALRQFITTAPPPAGYDPGPDPNTPPAPPVANPQLTYAAFSPTPWDISYTLAGNYTVDASTDLGAPFVQLLNGLCNGATNTTCSFNQTKPIQFKPGAWGGEQQANNCDQTGATPTTPTGTPPPDSDPNYYVIEYETAQDASFSIGAGLSLSTEVNLFDVVASEVSVNVEAEHEWREEKTYKRGAKVYIPGNSWGYIYVAPTIGTVTGTLTATIGSATFTATNFSQARGGVTGSSDPRTNPEPAWNTVTKTRPMTPAELAQFCGVGATASLKAAPARRSSRLIPHRSIGGVALGDTQRDVLRRLGQPQEKRFQFEPCAGMPKCAAVRGLGGTWKYRKLKHAIVFGPDRRVVAVTHRGDRRTREGVGKGSSMAALRGRFPRLTCERYVGTIDCTDRNASAQGTTRTVFRLTQRDGKRWTTAKVLMYAEGKS